MSERDAVQQLGVVLPDSVATQQDLARLLCELERADVALTDSETRQKVGAVSNNKVVFSDTLTDFLSQNRIPMYNARVRSQLLLLLRRFRDIAPVIHMTFAVEMDDESLQRLVVWARQSIHPQALLVIGVQPELIGGVYVRTQNHVHDLSVRARLKNARHLLVEELEAIYAGR